VKQFIHIFREAKWAQASVSSSGENTRISVRTMVVHVQRLFRWLNGTECAYHLIYVTNELVDIQGVQPTP
jgi:hypothetical protein